MQQLKGERVSPDHAANLLNKYFQGSQSTKSAVVLLADEVCVDSARVGVIWIQCCDFALFFPA